MIINFVCIKTLFKNSFSKFPNNNLEDFINEKFNLENNLKPSKYEIKLKFLHIKYYKKLMIIIF